MPPSSDLTTLSAVAARDAIKSGALSPVALVEACLARIRSLDPTLQAWIHVDEAGARAQAALREDEAKSGKLRGPLHGIPVGIKDIFDVEGMPTTAGARALGGARSRASEGHSSATAAAPAARSLGGLGGARSPPIQVVYDALICRDATSSWWDSWGRGSPCADGCSRAVSTDASSRSTT